MITKEEQKIFDKFTMQVLYDNGLKNISGAYCDIQVIDFDEDDIICKVVCVVEDEEGKQEDSWHVVFNRKIKTFKRY